MNPALSYLSIEDKISHNHFICFDSAEYYEYSAFYFKSSTIIYFFIYIKKKFKYKKYFMNKKRKKKYKLDTINIR